MGAAFLQDGMPLRLQPFLLLLDAAGIPGVELAASLERPPVGRFVLLALVARPSRNGHKDACRDGVGKIRSVFLRQIRADASDGQQPALRHGPHDLVVNDGRGKIHFLPSVLLDDGRVGDNLGFGHVRSPGKHGVEILAFFSGHLSRLLWRKDSIPPLHLQ